MINKIKFWFWVWHARGYPWVPNWYKNLSVFWSKKEQNLQRSLQATHDHFGQILIQATDDVAWGEETDSADDYQGFAISCTS